MKTTTLLRVGNENVGVSFIKVGTSDWGEERIVVTDLTLRKKEVPTSEYTMSIDVPMMGIVINLAEMFLKKSSMKKEEVDTYLTFIQDQK